jgi:hypothetical protein
MRVKTLGIWINSNLWIDHSHLNGYRKNPPALPLTLGLNTQARLTLTQIKPTNDDLQGFVDLRTGIFIASFTLVKIAAEIVLHTSPRLPALFAIQLL